MNNDAIQKLVEKTAGQAPLGAVLCVARGEEQRVFAAGALQEDSPYFIASTTKLHTTAIIMQLRSEGLLQLDDPIGQYLPADMWRGLHVWRGADRSAELSICQLLAHTSGLPDYFEGAGSRSGSLLGALKQGTDRPWTPAQALEIAKGMKPRFEPGRKGKAHYSDTNYQLLGLIIEHVCEKPYAAVFAERLATPLGLRQTYIYADTSDRLPADILYKGRPLSIPMAMSSFGPDGGAVSTAAETMIFLKAFFEGRLFPKAYLSEMGATWNNIFFPMDYGVGIMRFKLPRWLSPFRPMPTFVGHSGLSGAFAFYCPERDLYLSGTVNRLDAPQTSFRLMLKVAAE